MRLLDLARLLRFPNVFTALADISLGVLLVHDRFGDRAEPTPWLSLGLIAVASACLYCAGMVWNDYFDLAEDRRHRSFRPLASGRISTRFAGMLGTLLLGAGCLAAAAAGWRASGWQSQPLLLAGILAALILAYDGFLKRTALGPVAMGGCRFLNILLGVSLLPLADFSWAQRLHLASVVGVYIVGVTWFARTEEATSRRGELLRAAGVVAVALMFAIAFPIQFPEGTTSPMFIYLLVGFAFLIGLPIDRAIRTPTPGHVQAAVKRMILGLVVLDAVLAVALVGVVGLVILLLLPPALWLGKWVYST